MPTVNLLKADIIDRLGQLTEEEFDEICFSFGLELDEVTSEYEMVLKEQGESKAANCSKDIIYKIDVPANRYDLLCVEGLIRALMIFQKKIETPRYICNPKVASVIMNMTAATQKIRPFAVAAILRNVTFDESRYNSFITLQDKLHQNIGRKRSVVSIGTHDLDTIKAPFTYDAQRPADIKFVPLNENKVFTAEELMIHYSNESHLKPYLPIIRDSEVYPVIYDSCGTVLSMPPIVNGEHSKIKLATKNVFIEITATNLHKASVTLDTIVTMFSEYCAAPFEVEPVEVRNPDGSRHQYPELTYRKEVVSVEYINKLVGININATDMAALLERMSLKAEISGTVLSVEVPPTRHDILHRADIVEDVAIAFGYDNIPEVPHEISKGPKAGVQVATRLTDAIRLEAVKNQFTEVLTYALCSRDDVSTKLGKPLASVPAVHISNPKTLEFQVCRTSLLPGILKSISCNQSIALPIRLFEVQDAILLDDSRDVGAKNERRLCAVHYGMTPEFEFMMDSLFTVLSSVECHYQQAPIDAGMGTSRYTLEEVEDSVLMKGRSFAVKLGDGRDIGRLGIVHPRVVKAFGINKGMASMLEINIEHFY